MPQIDDIAQELAVSPRTLQRKIADEGTNFRQLLVDARRELAHEYLLQPTLSLKETACLLGFEDANSFHRAFRDWEGVTPGVWRDQRKRRIGASACPKRESSAGNSSRDDFQRSDFVSLKREKIAKVNGAAGKVASQMAGDRDFPILMFTREWLAGVLISCRSVRLPFFDCGTATMLVPFIPHDGVFTEALRNSLAVLAVAVK